MNLGRKEIVIQIAIERTMVRQSINISNLFNIFKLSNYFQAESLPLNSSWEEEGKEVGGGTLFWAQGMQDNILAGFSWGAVALQLPAGFLLDRYGAREVLGGMQAVAMLAALLSPSAAKTGPWFYFTIRVAQGVFCSAGWAAVTTVCARWAPTHEMGSFLTISTLGAVSGFCLGKMF